MSKLDKFLNESSLSDEAKKLIQEAWNEEKANVAAEMREEMKGRYQEDLARLTEGLDKMMAEVISEQMSDVYAEKRKLVEDRVKLRKTLGNFSDFANTVLAEEVKSMRQERKHINESLNKFMGFSNHILAEELKDFHDEKRQLVESRVKLIAEGSKQIAEARANFIKRTAESAATYIAETTEKNLTALKGELVEAKQNMFGRKIFEAFANEFYSKQYNESSILRELNESIKSKEDEAMASKVALQEAQNKAIAAERKIRIMEDKHARTAIIAELTKPLTSQQKQIMESLLTATPTEKLKEDFSKYHKSVLKGTVNESAANHSRPAVNTKAKNTLTEGKVVTGNRESNFIKNEELDADDLNFLNEISQLSGINKKR
ncbi:putative scaffolding protein [Erwinia phage pEa_SNUABM_50]|uniref:Scaffolding protein n=4 Tax=Eneladusvirus BF TaxID=2560751 RepID=A0A1S6UBI6_9CAUD|nr:scaffolding protein [Serratia phage BF]QOI71191.1 putative scaffolding protein [Erwinia phage pEa_SNUABM_12]QOI71735.1 putative scaffolding protein [Erwinia phage pEa_SNUABM_47]QOI72274.1 putative scaffolding protein [Erwinia phage pEa_SNUABM_50]QXO11400.1 hypothetical protein pEaSNUABM19_00254 [Erwinia phage pEa_SNUABM_19]QXO11948.1 hypothetical protein pEaSNUABM44_00252 [Erwinia phage pEa_SNUABM_44]QXO12501.1 hypothetical protein pEaSNUABM49_00255 [Erwinia phage pEa_SNUABM_49]